MHPHSYILFLLATITPALAAPSKALEPRGVSQCDQLWSSISIGNFTIYADEWGVPAQPNSGSQCSQINGLNGNSLGWQTNWTWSPPTQVKTYTHVESNTTSCKELSAYTEIPTTWSWNYSGNALQANVAYDTFVGTNCTFGQAYEVMVWLGVYGTITPIGPQIATTTVGNTPFNLHGGKNGNITVYSFVAQTNITSYSGDLYPFFQYLADPSSPPWTDVLQPIPGTDYLQSIQAGTEAFSGSNASLLTSGYTVSSS